jgi:hypothetical protein
MVFNEVGPRIKVHLRARTKEKEKDSVMSLQ